jgi:hypothetical protein
MKVTPTRSSERRVSERRRSSACRRPPAIAGTSYLALAALLLPLAVFLCLAPAAPAAVVTDRPLLFSFDGHDTTAGVFGDERSLEVEQASGDVFVVDQKKRVLDKFSAEGVAQNFAGTGASSVVVPSASNIAEGDIAVDNTAVNPGRLYTATGQGGPLSAFEPTGNLLWKIPFNSSFDRCGAAVDSAGHLWVLDRSSKLALEFASSGSPPAQIGSFPLAYTNGGVVPCSLDFDAAGDAYIAASNGGGGVFKYVGGAYDSTLDPEESHGVAVDRASGHVFTSHHESFDEYDAGGALIGSFGKGVLSSASGIAVNQSGAGGVEAGTVYVTNFYGHKIYAFGPETTGTVPDVTAEAATEVEVSKVKLHGKVKPNSVPNAYFFEWKPGTSAENWGAAKSSPPQSLPEDNSEHPVSFNVTGLAGNTTYQARLVGLNTADGLREVSAPVTLATNKPAGPPAVTIDPVEAAPTPPCTTGIGGEGACVSGTVNPREDFSTSWWTETSEAEETEEGPRCKSFPKLSGSGIEAVSHKLESEANSPVEVHEDLSGLLPSQRYCVRIAAKNSFNAKESDEASRSATEEFLTLPIPPDQVVTAFAAPRTETSARINAYANPEGEVMSYRFEYSADGGADWIDLGWREDESEVRKEARKPLLFAAELTGLSPGAEYSFRFSARNHCHPNSEPEAWCEVDGGTKVFATRTSAEAAALDPSSCPNEEVRLNRGFAYLPQCRGAELVNNPDDGNQNVGASGGQGTPPLSPDGEKALWNVAGGAPGGNSGAGATFLAKRTGPTEAAPTGWQSKTLIPPAAQQVEAEEGSYGLAATTPAFSSFLFAAGSQLGGGKTLVRIGESGNQDVLKAYPQLQDAGNSDLSADGAHVLRVETGGSGEEEQLEDIGAPGKPEVLSYLPDGTLPECGVDPEGGSFVGGGNGKGASGQWRPGYQLIAAADASRVYFQVKPNGSICGNTSEPWWLLERDREAGETLELAPPDQLNALIRATPDGRSVYFVSELKLDHEGKDTNEGVDVYRWDEATRTDACLTCGVENEAGETIADANLRVDNGAATPVMVSEDFSHIYFESESKLTPQATPGQYNLYALALGSGRLRFVAAPNAPGARTTLGRGLGSGQAELSRDGSVLVFETTEAGNHDLSADRLAASCPDLTTGGPGPCRELFRYDDRDRSLECISCAHGATTSATVGSRGGNDFRISADGQTVAFVTAQALAPRDVNNGLDLYEWRAGERRLLTDGRGDFGQGGTAALQPYALSEDGADILFKVTDPGLTGFEANGFANLYDARIGGGFEVPPAPERCSEESCQGPLVAPPPFGQPGSAGFEGAGNASEARSCSPAARRAKSLRRRAKSLRRRAAGMRNRRRAARLRRRAARCAHRAHALGGQARRCRRRAAK